VEEYQRLGFVDISVLLASDDDFPLRKKIFQSMIETLPPDEKFLEKVLTDNIKQVKRKWFKEQHRQIKIKLSQAQENGNEEAIKMLLQEKENILTKEKALR